MTDTDPFARLLRCSPEELRTYLKEDRTLVQLKNERGENLLHCAIARDRTEHADVAIVAGFNVDTPTRQIDEDVPTFGVMPTGGETPLHLAARRGNVAIVDALLARGADPNRIDAYGLTPLQRAVALPSLRIAKSLAEGGANLDVRTSDRMTLLHSAVIAGSREVVEWLISIGADPNAVDWRGTPPLTFCVQGDSAELAQILLESGANAMLLDQHKLPPIHSVARARTAKVLEVLLRHGVPPGERDAFGTTPLHLCISSKECVALLLSFGADPNMGGPDARTAVHEAAYLGEPIILEMLLKAGGDLSTKDIHGKTPLDYAKRFKRAANIDWFHSRRQ